MLPGSSVPPFGREDPPNTQKVRNAANSTNESTTEKEAWTLWEGLGALLALVVGFHFLALRVHAGGLPGGDEGSWLSVAAELARGNGFTTRWLEAHFLTPYTLPRPDDFRYPALTSLLAAVFQFTGFSIEAARWTVATVFLIFASSTYLLCRSAFGRWTAMTALWLTCLSLLQLQWNSIVYTEGLFGLAVTGVAAWCLRGERTLNQIHRIGFQSKAWWFLLGAMVGCVYLVRANGILFLIGIPILFWRRKQYGIGWKHPSFACAGFLFIASPWLIHMAEHFGNPMHVAGNAGMLRTAGESHTFSITQFIVKHGFFFPLERITWGTFHFFRDLHFFEHGLEAAPIVLVLLSCFRRRSFISPFLTGGFLITFFACVYTAYDSWAGVRYMSGLLPLVYAYGLSSLRHLWGSGKSATWLSWVLALLLLLPVLMPHRFYERKYANPGMSSSGLADHLYRLKKFVPTGESYYAASLCKVNFMVTERYCIGLQELYDPTWFSRSIDAFHPQIVMLTREETKDSVLCAALTKMRIEGYRQDTLEVTPLAVYFSLRTTP